MNADWSWSVVCSLSQAVCDIVIDVVAGIARKCRAGRWVSIKAT